MAIWPPDADALRRPAWRSLVEAVEAAIEAGELAPGRRLPTHRRLAQDLGLGTQTVGRAYEELTRRGRVRGEVGRGTFVAGPRAARTPFIADRAAGEVVDLSMLKPVPDPEQAATLARTLAAVAREMPEAVVSSFRPSTVAAGAEGATRRWLRTCGIGEGRSALLTNGATAAMTVALLAAASPGDLVVTEEVGHHTLRPLARHLGLRLRGLAVDGEGMRPDALGDACRAEPVRAAYLMPTGLNPLGFTMGEGRRADIVAAARRHGVTLIENDAWGPLSAYRPTPLAALAPERTLWFTSLTKCVMPGLRLGWLVTPGRLEEAAANRHLVTAWMVTPLMAEIGAQIIEDGSAERLVGRQRAALAARLHRARASLGGDALRGSPGGMHVWLPLPDRWREDALVAHARRRGVALAPGSAFAVDDATRHRGIRLCLGGEEDAAFDHGLRETARLLSSEPEPALLM